MVKRKKPPRPAQPSADELVAKAREHGDRGELTLAEARFREALALAPDHIGILAMLGGVLVERGNADEAIDLLERARVAVPDFAPVHFALGTAYAMAGHDEIAVASMEIAGKLDPSSSLPFERLARLHIRAHRPREAIGVLRRVLRRDPTNTNATFMLAALTGENAAVPTDMPPELVADLFDTYASTFDTHLEGLAYRVPKALAALVGDVEPTARDWVVVDLGCGTGLAGVELRDRARTLIGCDLSPRMIDRAKERAIYDELHVEDLAATLSRASGVDLIVAADVFIYLGALDQTIAACAKALRPGGLLAFSTEKSDGADVALQPTLRQKHSESYLVGLARANELTVERAEPSILRVDQGESVHGILYLLRRGTM